MTTLITKPALNIQIGSKVIDGQSAYIIAEMACAHDGDYEKAKALIDAAVNSAADAVQLQFFHTPANMVKQHKIYPLLKKIEFTKDQWANLVDYGRKSKIDVFACAYDMPSLKLAIDLNVDGIKFNSADLNNFEMVEVVARSNIPFTLGTGASSLGEIGQAIKLALAEGGNKFVLMHGMQSFPTSIERANLRRIKLLASSFDALVGYADHTDGDDLFASNIDLVALGMGACIFEKHYTLNRALKGTDYQAALNPDELARYVKNVRQGVFSIGSSNNETFNSDEIRYRNFQKKKLVATKNLSAGHIITRKDIVLLRTEETDGLTSSNLSSIIGKKLIKPVNQDKLFKIDFF